MDWIIPPLTLRSHNLARQFPRPSPYPLTLCIILTSQSLAPRSWVRNLSLEDLEFYVNRTAFELACAHDGPNHFRDTLVNIAILPPCSHLLMALSAFGRHHRLPRQIPMSGRSSAFEAMTDLQNQLQNGECNDTHLATALVLKMFAENSGEVGLTTELESAVNTIICRIRQRALTASTPFLLRLLLRVL